MKDTLKKSTLLAASAAMLASMAACGPSAPFAQGRGPVLTPQRVGSFGAAPRARAGKDWTLMFHVAADNNLYSFALEDVNEMEAGLAANPAAAASLDIIVLFDGTPNGDSKILRIKPDPGPVNKTIVSEVIDDKGFVIPANKEIDSGDAATAAKFVDFATKNFPSANNLHAFWNHGSGIFRSGTSSPEFNAGTSFFDTVVGGGISGQKTRGNASKVFAADDHGTEMFLRDVNPIMAVASQNLGKNIDVVGFDACLMQHIETAYQYKGQASILVASEELEPGKGWAYDKFIGPLAQNTKMSPAQLSTVMVDSFVKSYMPGGSQGSGTVTLSAIDINAVSNNLVPALNEYAAALTASLPTAKAAISAARAQTQGFYNRDAVDIGDFVRKYKPAVRDQRTAAASARLEAALKQTVIAEGHYGSKVAGATGNQVYFPTATMSFNKRYADPSFLRFAETQGWGGFLQAFTAK